MTVRLNEAVAVVVVLVLAVAATWPALRVAFGGGGQAPTAVATPAPAVPMQTFQAPLPSFTPVVPTPTPSAATTSSSSGLTLKLVAPSYAVNGAETVWDTVAADFHAANPDITVDIDQQSSGALVGERAIAEQADLMIGLPVEAFAGQNLNPYYAADEIAPPGNDVLPYFAYAASTADANGKTKKIGIPVTASALELFYNKQIFAQAHVAKPPATWNDIAADAARINAVGKTGIGLPMGTPDTLTTLQLWTKGNGGGLMNAAKTTYTVNQAANVDTLRWLEDTLIKPGLSEFSTFEAGESAVKQDFAEGDLGMVVADPGLIAQTQAGAVGTAFGTAHMAGRSGTTNYTLGTVDDLIASRAHPENKAAIAKFVAFLLQPKYQKLIADHAGTLPVTRSGVAAESQNTLLKPFLDALSSADWLPTGTPSWTALEDYVSDAGAQVNDPKLFLDHAQAAATGR